MNAQQKQAWLSIVALFLSAVGFAVLLPHLGLSRTASAFALLGLIGIGPLIFRREGPDERNLSINRRAALLAGMVSYLTFIFGCMGVWTVYWLHGKETISVHVLAAIAAAGAIVLIAVHSLSIIFLYRVRWGRA